MKAGADLRGAGPPAPEPARTGAEQDQSLSVQSSSQQSPQSRIYIRNNTDVEKKNKNPQTLWDVYTKIPEYGSWESTKHKL